MKILDSFKIARLGGYRERIDFFLIVSVKPFLPLLVRQLRLQLKLVRNLNRSTFRDKLSAGFLCCLCKSVFTCEQNSEPRIADSAILHPSKTTLPFRRTGNVIKIDCMKQVKAVDSFLSAVGDMQKISDE